MIHPPSTDPAVPSAATATRLLETGMELLRAEVAVATARGRHAALRAVTALLATILAAALLQVALVVFILAPLLARTLPSEGIWIWIALSLPGVLALASLVGAGFAWGSLRRSLRGGAPTRSSENIRPEGSSGSLLVSLKQERVPE